MAASERTAFASNGGAPQIRHRDQVGCRENGATMRYAIYWVPSSDDALWTAANRWLGRDPETGAQFDVPPARRAAIAEPARYGFHATLKPPFALAAGRTGDALIAAAGDFARATPTFEAPALRIARLGRFLALVPSAPAPALHGLAEACIVAFDGFRAPAHPDEIARRRKAGLTARQDEYLLHWGYPYVFEEFRFHMTLTGSLPDDALAPLETELAAAFAAAVGAPISIREIAIFAEAAPDAPFRLIRRLPLGSS